MADYDIAVLVGSLRKDSFNRKMANALAKMSAPSLKLDIVEIGDQPLYNQDLDASPPPQWVALRNRVRAAHGVLFVTPEYNRSVPGVLKNAIDIASRPYGQSAWDRKPAGVISLSLGGIGAFGANHHLRQSLVYLNMPTMQQPEAYIGGAATLFDTDGNLVKDDTRKFLEGFLKAFTAWVALHTGKV